jgi:hypothetical protein
VTNINPETGIAYGYISADALHPEIVQELQNNGTDIYYEDAKAEAQREVAREWCTSITATGALELPIFRDRPDMPHETERLDEDLLFDLCLVHVKESWEGSDWEQAFNDSYQPDEPVHEGEKDDVKYRTSWLGGALNVWIFESPHITDKARRASPCVPNAGILDVLDGDVQAYDVPANWRDDDGR